VTFGGAETRKVSWNGITAAGPVADGNYLLKLSDSGTAGASVSGGQTPAVRDAPARVPRPRHP
jgi:hypothetical protein